MIRYRPPKGDGDKNERRKRKYGCKGRGEN